ncbi:hypothetical protein AGDE_09887 [Angomonas deanei]|nr:hypothetical protein AGDE_09887 [Angomonas deanei]|eukprot:EPY29724.1 hypothetical protein AGDE_09887 [Angomonas deanei]
MRCSRRQFTSTAASRQFCLSLAEAHGVLSQQLFAYKKLPVTSASGAVHVTNKWWASARQIVVPRQLREIEDLPLFLLESLRVKNTHAGAAPVTNPFAAMGEEEIIKGFLRWVSEHSVTHSEWIAYVELMGLFQTFVRYHNGVRWGASPESSRSAGSYFRRVYSLHPYHHTYCPDGWDAQKPFVHILQWMLEKGSGDGDSALWEKYRALEPFSPPRQEGGVSDYAALDVCSQSGFAVDLLLRAGARNVLSLDTMSRALENVEQTVSEHFADKRSSAGKSVSVRCCDVLPEPGTFAVQPDFAKESVFQDAATRRRKAARQLGQALDLELNAEPTRSSGPFDVLYYHPPIPSLTPFTILSEAPGKHSVWWTQVGQQECAPFLVAPSAATAVDDHPHLSLHSLEAMVNSLRLDVTQRAAKLPPEWRGTPPQRALLKDNGYCIFVLPRTYDVESLLYAEGGDKSSLSDWVLAQLDGFYDVVIRRRYPVQANMGAALGGVLDLLNRNQKAVKAEVDQVCSRGMWVDVLVLRKNANAASLSLAANYPENYSSRKKEVEQLRSILREKEPDNVHHGVLWEDSFEYNEYKPKSLTKTNHHWTDLVPTYSYLEDTFYDNKEAVQSNFLAVGHPPRITKKTLLQSGATDGTVPVRSPQQYKQVTEAAAKFKSIFADELRTKRKAKIRKLALSPLQRQEWYIDEKLVRSEASKIEFMNELSRWDLKDYD